MCYILLTKSTAVFSESDALYLMLWFIGPLFSVGSFLQPFKYRILLQI